GNLERDMLSPGLGDYVLHTDSSLSNETRNISDTPFNNVEEEICSNIRYSSDTEGRICGSIPSSGQHIAMDLNGDGFDDVIVIPRSEHVEQKLKAFINTGDGEF